MDKEDIALRKLEMLMRAVSSTEPPEWEQELREGAWMILHQEPGTDREEWRKELILQYPTEVVDTFGTDPADAYAQMDDWWESETYEDHDTGICETYKDWADIFATEKSVMIYDELARLNVKISRLGLRNKLK